MKRPDVGLCAECKHARVAAERARERVLALPAGETDTRFERYRGCGEPVPGI